jgi:hypothetical protein
MQLMKLRIKWYWHALALVAAVVIIGMRARTLLDYMAWRSGTDVVAAKIDKVEDTPNGVKISFSYGIGAETYHNQFVGIESYDEGIMTSATYAKSNPAVSTLDADLLQASFNTALVASALALLPLVLLWGAELGKRSKRAEPDADSGLSAGSEGPESVQPEAEATVP